MDTKNIQCKNPKAQAESKPTIDIEINHPVYGWIPFTASPNDVEAHGREIYAKAVAGEYGEIEVVAPVQPEISQEVLDEQKIQSKIRAMAIERLTLDGEIAADFVDKKEV